MIRFRLLLILTMILFCTVTYGQEGDCHDCIECLVDFNIYVSHGGQFCDGSESSTEQIQFQYRTIHGNWLFLESYNGNKAVTESSVTVRGTSDTQLQFRWIQNNTLESPAWVIDDIVIFCYLNDFNIIYTCHKDISFEETIETLETSRLECHSGIIHRGTATCSHTENSLLLNGTEREIRTTPFSFSNCNHNENKKFFNTCKECKMEMLFNTTWAQSYIGTELTHPCMISEANITRTCDVNGAWIPSPIDTYNRCARNNSVCLGPSLSHGLVWSTIQVNATARMQCSEISELFWSGLNATRKCLDGGVWDEVDMSQCTMKNNRSSLITYSTHLNMTDNGFHSGSQINTELQRLLEGPNVTINYEITVKNALDSGVIFIMKLTNNLSLVQNISNSINRNFKKFHKKNFIPSEIVKMIPDGVCHCNNAISISGEAYLRVLETNICVGSLHPPCIYDISSKCNRPFYAGNDTLCGRDTDQDGIPDVNLGCDGASCQQDVCRWINDPDNQNTCNAETTGCEMERDRYFGIEWPWAEKNYTVQRTCPDGTGITSRHCNHLGRWDDVPPDVRTCSSFAYQELLINLIADGVSPEVRAELVNRVLDTLANLVTPSGYSIFPLDIQTTHFVISKILDVVEMAPNLLREEGFDNTFVGIASDILNIKNEPGFEQLTDVNRTVNQMLIVNSERLGIILANNTDSNKTFVTENIVLSIEKRNASSNSPILFPLQDSPDKYNNNTEIDVTNSSILIPASLIQRRAKFYADNTLPIANIIYFNLEKFLPRTENLSNPDDKTNIPVSAVISSQVGCTNSSVSSDDPVILEFHYSTDSNANNTRCAFWNFDLIQNGGDGGWDITGISVAYSNSTFIRCNSTHLTCFAVLVDIHGGASNIKEEEALALSIVSYFGCGISMLSLLGAISLIIVYRKTLLKEIHNFAHLNLTIALFLALAVFAAGIETAAKNKIACTIVAALLHYLFTAVFSWMLCEGILLYVLLVKVFSTGLVKKKRLYFLLGWGIPLPIVAVSVGIAHNDYGTDDFCWISFDTNVVWAFVGPMVLIILINTIFLFMALQVLFKSKSHNRTTEEVKRRDIVKSMIRATVLLLPLLGLTWIFGLLIVNEHLTVFAWLFTVLNSLQGLFIFMFHVIRIEKVRNRIKDTAAFKAMKHLISVKDRVTYKTGTSIKLNTDFGNGTTKPSSAEGNGSNHHVEPIKTSTSPQSSEKIQQQTNSTDGILCTAV